MPDTPKQTGSAVEHVFDIGETVPLAAEIEDHAGIKAATAGSHNEPVERTESGGRGDAASVVESTEAGA